MTDSNPRLDNKAGNRAQIQHQAYVGCQQAPEKHLHGRVESQKLLLQYIPPMCEPQG